MNFIGGDEKKLFTAVINYYIALKQIHTTMAALTTVSGYVSLLDENEDNQVKAYALEQLNALVDQFWAEIADIETIKKM
jgi:hypothetical protein